MRVLHRIAGGRKRRKRLAVQAAEPARIEEMHAKVKLGGKLRIKQISINLRARFAYLDLLPPSKNPAVWLGYCLVEKGESKSNIY